MHKRNVDSPSTTSGLRYFSTQDRKNLTIESGKISQSTSSRRRISISYEQKVKQYF